MLSAPGGEGPAGAFSVSVEVGCVTSGKLSDDLNLDIFSSFGGRLGFERRSGPCSERGHR